MENINESNNNEIESKSIENLSNSSNIDTNKNKKKSNYKPVKTKSYVNRNLNSELIDFKTLTHEQLIVEATRLQSHVFQLRNLLNKSQQNSQNSSSQVQYQSKKNKAKSNRANRVFDFNKYNKRHVLLKFAYLGWNYQGYILQEGVHNTVENLLFEALIRTKLIESRETSNYHRCGRTDKGVSAFSQVISIDLRSNCASGTGVVVNPNSNITNTDIKSEINYIKLLNGALPDDIRALCWSPVNNEFSARFDCTERIYRYYFPKGDLDIDLMRDAGRRLIGEKDYRNFCKMDIGNGVVTFFRRIDDIKIEILDKEPNNYSVVELIVEGSSFLWHQIRCIVAVLFLVGQKKEEPSIIDDLLDIEKYPCKPQYTMGSENPLVLFDCQYEGIDWVYDKAETERVIKHFQDIWLNHYTQASIVKRMIDNLEPIVLKKNETDENETENDKLVVGSNSRSLNQPYSLLQGRSQSFNYIKFKDRKTSYSLETRVDHYVKKRRLDADVYEKINENNNLAQSLNIYKPNHTDKTENMNNE